jgi:hypothetical protein
LRVVARPAVVAASAADRGWNDDAVSGPEAAAALTYLCYYADRLMSKNASPLDSWYCATDKVKICAAYRARGEANDHVIRLLDLWLRHALQANVPDPMEDDSLHFSLLFIAWRAAAELST